MWHHFDESFSGSLFESLSLNFEEPKLNSRLAPQKSRPGVRQEDFGALALEVRV